MPEKLYSRPRQKPEPWGKIHSADRERPRVDAVALILKSTVPFAVLKSTAPGIGASGTSLLVADADARRLNIGHLASHAPGYDALRVVEVDEQQNRQLNRIMRQQFTCIDLGEHGQAYEPSDRPGFSDYYRQIRAGIRANRRADAGRKRETQRLSVIAANQRRYGVKKAKPVPVIDLANRPALH